jgi:ketosteroid isomerase-like protein
MTQPAKVLTALVLSAVLFLVFTAPVGAQTSQQQEKKAAELAAITKVSDSAYGVFKKAIATSDIDLLLSFFVDTGGVVMPDMQGLLGLDNIRKSAPTLMRVVGGGDLEIQRESMRLRDELDVARDAGTFTVTRTMEDGSVWRFDGLHTLFWKKTADGVWKLDRAFIGENPRARREAPDSSK